jgi:hypothetical protein
MQVRTLARASLVLPLVACGGGARDITGSSAAPDSAFGVMQKVGDMAEPRAAHQATLLADGRVLLTGGFGRSSALRSAELFDPATNTFSPTGSMLSPRVSHTATALPDGRVLIAGGINGDALASAELYDPRTGRFSATGPLGTARGEHRAALLANGTVLIVGGIGGGYAFLASAELYDVATGTFGPTGSMSVARESHTMTTLADGRVLIAGGHRGRHEDIVIHRSVEVYDPATSRFSAAGSLAVPRHKHDAVLRADGRVMINGGSDERDDRGAYASVELFDPSSGASTRGGAMPAVRFKHVGTSVRLSDGRVLIAGGARHAVVYHPSSGRFGTVVGALGSASLSRLVASATLLRDGGVLLTGGYGQGQSVSAGAWRYRR